MTFRTTIPKTDGGEEDEKTERNESLNNSKSYNSKEDYDNRSTSSKNKSNFSFEKDKIQVIKPMKKKENKDKSWS